MDLQKTTGVIARMGILILRNGAASFRAEEVMHRTATTLGVQDLDTFVTPSAISVTAHSDGLGSATRTLKVVALGVNLSRVVAIERLSRQAISVDEFAQRLDAIEATPLAYSTPLIVVAVGIACGAFAAIQGGGPFDFAAAAVSAICTQWVRMGLNNRHVNPYLVTAICAALATLLSYLLVHALGLASPRLAMIASVLLLVPGVPLVTALFDLVHLDFLSGLSRGIYSALIIANIGVGMALILALTGSAIF